MLRRSFLAMISSCLLPWNPITIADKCRLSNSYKYWKTLPEAPKFGSVVERASRWVLALEREALWLKNRGLWDYPHHPTWLNDDQLVACELSKVNEKIAATKLFISDHNAGIS